MSDVRAGRIPVTGGTVWYRIVGAGKEGFPLLVLHGGPGAPHDYLQPLEGLAGERPVVFYDHLGSGQSDKPDNALLWTPKRFVDELAQVREALGMERVHILGQSWGGALAVEYMLTQEPKGVGSLVLSAPLISASRWAQDQQAYVAELPEGAQQAIRQSEASGAFESPEYQEAMMGYYRLHLCRMDPWPDYVARAFEQLNLDVYQYMWGPSEFTITGTLKDFERVDQLKKIEVPVLFTAGEYDEAPPATIRYFQENLPGSEVAVFPNASHMHHIEQEDEYRRVVREFVRRAEGG